MKAEGWAFTHPWHHERPLKPHGCDESVVGLPQLSIGRINVELDHLLRVVKRRLVEAGVWLKEVWTSLSVEAMPVAWWAD